jgi:hypothetical protein
MPSRIYFKTSLVHSCYLIDRGDLRPKPKCRCRKYVSREQASELVRLGAATWVLDDSDGKSEPIPQWDIVLLGQTSKTPRAATLERSHLERGTELSDSGYLAQNMMKRVEGEEQEEDRELFEVYHDLEVVERMNLFSCGAALKQLKEESDRFKTLRRDIAVRIAEMFATQSTKIKNEVAVDDPREGMPVLSYIGMNQETKNGK